MPASANAITAGRRLALAATLLLGAGQTGHCHALFGSEFELQGRTMLADHMLANVFYLVPEKPRVAVDEDGRPVLSLTLSYYVGTELRDDVGANQVDWLLQIGLERTPLSAGLRNELIRALQSRATSGRHVVLRDLPILSTPTSVVFAPIDTPEHLIRLGNANVAPASTESSNLAAVDNAYWTRRSIAFPLSEIDGSVLRTAFEGGGSLMSISTGYKAAGVVLDDNSDMVSYRRAAKNIASDSIDLRLDDDARTSFLRIVDLNAVSPPGYPGLTVLCYDFLSPVDEWMLQDKTVFFEATGIAGRTVRTSLRFPINDPEVSLQRAKFPFAVRVDKPYRYRTRSFMNDGLMDDSDWIEVRSWIDPLDVSDYLDDNEEQ